MSWPDDADGDVFRRLVEHGFDFSKPHTVDYNVDFDAWPPTQVALDILRSMFGTIRVFEPDDESSGYIQFQIHGPVSYEAVTSTQRKVTAAMVTHGGICESWGVMQDAV
jgi:hypothetical protein